MKGIVKKKKRKNVKRKKKKSLHETQIMNVKKKLSKNKISSIIKKNPPPLQARPPTSLPQTALVMSLTYRKYYYI